jgi:malate permease and related proteins
MPHVFNTIIPVFVVIALGWLLRIRGFLPLSLMGSLNRLVYFLALPALIFREIAGASASIQINPWLLVGTLTPSPIISLLASPTASIAYVMAVEMGGSPELASASISIGTLASLITYMGWLTLSG